MASHPDPSSTPPDFHKLGDEIYGHWETAMTSWWDQVLDSPAFLGAMGKNLEATAKARGQYERSVDDSMQRLHLPTRADVVRIARIAGQLENRLLEAEDITLELRDRLTAMEREVIQARIEAAEARLELRTTLADLRGDLAALRQAAPEDRAPVRASGAPRPKGAVAPAGAVAAAPAGAVAAAPKGAVAPAGAVAAAPAAAAAVGAAPRRSKGSS